MYYFYLILENYIPKQVSILIINPTENSLFDVLGEENGGEAEVVDKDIPEYLKNMTFVASKIKKIQVPVWAKSLINIGENSILFLGKHNNQKIAVANFDFHNTDLPLKSEFPMLINYICEELIENDIVNSNYIGGQDIKISGSLAYDKLIITTPSGRVRTVDNNSILNENLELGVYSIEDNNNRVNERFSINFPSNDEGDVIDNIVEGKESVTSKNISTKGMLDITPYIIGLVMVLIIIEWVLYNKGY